MALFQLADNDEIELMVSDLTIINTIYILRRMHYGLSEIYDSLDNIRPLLTITSMGATVVDRCLQHRSDDFEDEMQYFSAIDANADYIITRNKKDFDFGDSAVMTPQEFFKEQNIEFE